MALIVSSASWRRRRRSSIAGDERSRRRLAIGLSRPSRTDVESHENALLVRHVADQAAKRRGQLLDQRRRGDDLVAARQRQVLVDVHDLEGVEAAQVLLADAADGLGPG